VAHMINNSPYNVPVHWYVLYVVSRITSINFSLAAPNGWRASPSVASWTSETTGVTYIPGTFHFYLADNSRWEDGLQRKLNSFLSCEVPPVCPGNNARHTGCACHGEPTDWRVVLQLVEILIPCWIHGPRSQLLTCVLSP
jgi:hypothetical protein